MIDNNISIDDLHILRNVLKEYLVGKSDKEKDELLRKLNRVLRY